MIATNISADGVGNAAALPSKASLRRAKMAHFNAQLEAEKARLGALDLPLAELVELLHGDSFFTELAAMHWVMVRNQTEPEAVMTVMLAGLEHPQWKVRRTCADFMDHFGDQRCVEYLLRALKDPHENVRRLALHSLSCQTCKTCPLNGDFVPPLAEMAQSDRSARTRRIATATLGNYLHDARAVEVLERLAADSRDDAVAARARTLLALVYANAAEAHCIAAPATVVRAIAGASERGMGS